MKTQKSLKTLVLALVASSVAVTSFAAYPVQKVMPTDISAFCKVRASQICVRMENRGFVCDRTEKYLNCVRYHQYYHHYYHHRYYHYCR